MAIPTQAVRSAEPEASAVQAEVDLDCLPREEAPPSPLARDGVCPEGSDGAGPPAPEPLPDLPTPPMASTGAGEQPAVAGATPDTTAADLPEEGRGGATRGRDRPAAGPDGRGGRGARPRDAGGNRSFRGERAGARAPARARREHAGDRRASRARRHSTGRRDAALRVSSRPVLGPIPGWARRLLARPLPDPLPTGKRLDPAFAGTLRRVASRHDVGWATVLAVLRARGHAGAAPAGRREVVAVARKLGRLGGDRRPRRAVTALVGTHGAAGAWQGAFGEATVGESFDDRVAALAAYHRAVGLRGLVRGLVAVRPALIRRALGDPRLALYPGGRADVAAGRIDGRVLVLLLYLADRHGSVTVSSLQSGHGFFTTSGNVSAHSFGRAVDVAALGGVSIAGHQDPGGVTERALRNVLLLPAELRPRQLISLFALGGPSFAMADHADHVHVGY